MKERVVTLQVNVSGEAVTVVSDVEILGDTRDGLIRSLIQKYHPGLTYTTGVAVEEDDSAYYGEWDEGVGLTFTTECDTLTDEEMAYVVLHEIAHALTNDGRHQDCFYGVLTALVRSEGVSWPVAIRIEELIPLLWVPYADLAQSQN